MKLEGKRLDTFLEVSQQLRDHTWDIVEDWHEEAKLSLTQEQIYLPCDSQDIIDELPTLIGGIAKVIYDPVFLMDLEAGGSLYLVCQQFGRLRHETGYQINKLLDDFSLLRQKLWVFCEKIVPPEDVCIFELERRINLALDRITSVAISAYYNRSCIELVELAQKDKLTGFLHLRAFNALLDSELSRSKRYHSPLSIMSADIDSFKQFNVEEGRLEGNRLLQQIAREIISIVRTTDHAARLAGDEFAVIMPQTTSAQAKYAAERVRRQVRQLRQDDHLTTMSIGIASFPENANDKNGLIEWARIAMSEAQKEGGDVIHQSSQAGKSA